MKKVIAIFVVLLLAVFALSACARASEKMAEGIVEGMFGGKVDIEGDNVTIKGEDGNTSMTLTSDGTWPKDKMGDLPELKGKVTSTLESGGGCVVYVEAVEEGDATAYIDKIKDLGYADVMEMTSDDGTIVFTGTKDQASVVFSYSGDGYCMITYAIENSD